MSAIELLALAMSVVAILMAALACRLAARLKQAGERESSAIEKIRREIAEEVHPAIARIDSALSTLASAQQRSARPADLSNLSTTDLLEQLREAKRLGDPDEVLDIREMLIPRMDDARRERTDAELADWFTRHFQTALRSGRAALIAPALGRAVEVLGKLPQMKHLAEALPTVRQSVGLCPQCGLPYRGAQPSCPRCMAANLNRGTAIDELDELDGGSGKNEDELC